ncbi:response regulator [Paenibacillus sp. FSL E2-0177]|uniref:response regulator n=1 Tax=Paenibacillus sp. FSL E2-0177 TaxID=2921360 RepID=UPI0030EE7AA7
METILIIEDDAKLVRLLSTYLSKYGFRTIIVEDFNRVLETFNESSADLILLDVNLPKYDGFYWCRQIRSLPLCPILFISARIVEWIR